MIPITESGLPFSKYFKVPGTLSYNFITSRGSLTSFKGSSRVETVTVRKYSALYMMLFVPSTTQFWVQLCQTMSFSVVDSGMLAHYSSNTNRFIQRQILVVLHVSITLVVGSPANSRCFISSPLSVSELFLSNRIRKQNMRHFQT